MYDESIFLLIDNELYSHMVFCRVICVCKVSAYFITVFFCLLSYEYDLNVVNEIIVLLGASTPWKMSGTGILRDFIDSIAVK
ncbi:hypothetical protein BK718_35730 [Bacillus thuringiensis serovar andalousiensis]|nr:hypothetical protein BK718_35730 [Bacillus thuringiensis serovar andalousiensis]